MEPMRRTADLPVRADILLVRVGIPSATYALQRKLNVFFESLLGRNPRLGPFSSLYRRTALGWQTLNRDLWESGKGSIYAED